MSSPPLSTTLVLLLLLLISLLSITTTSYAQQQEEEDVFDKDDWYTRYPRYPEYCSTPSQMQQRQIPPLQKDAASFGETRLVHASVVIRHGARTPWSNQAKCWKGYWDNPSTATWDCRLNQLVAPPSETLVLQEEEEEEEESNSPPTKSSSNRDGVFLFQKLYDAFQNHPNNNHGGTAHDEGLSNKLNGTCQVGQLLLQGYEQELSNGKFIKQAYGYNGDKDYDHDVRMRLLDLSTDQPWKDLWFRSDDDERTVMSGQVLVRGMLEDQFVQYTKQHAVSPVLNLHTADRDRDVLSANSRICPKLNELWNEALDSHEFQRWNASKESRKVRVFMKHKLGQLMDKDPVDCLMTTICTDRPLPAVIDDYHGGSSAGDRRRMLQECDSNNCTTTNVPTNSPTTAFENDKDEDSWFYRIAQYSIQQFMFPFLYNGAAYSKLAIAPLWREIMANIVPLLQRDTYDRYNEAPKVPKLALFSGHDTTIVPLLASLNLWNDTDWPPYASMMIIEIHELIDDLTDRSVFPSDFAFRLVYNGRVLTGWMDGCREDLDLCDARVLQDVIGPLATKPWQCHAPPPTGTFATAWAETKVLLGMPGGVLLLLLVVCASGTVGGVGVFVYLTRRLPFGRKEILPQRWSAQRFRYARGISMTDMRRTDDNENSSHSSLYGSADTSPRMDNSDHNHRKTIVGLMT